MNGTHPRAIGDRVNQSGIKEFDNFLFDNLIGDDGSSFNNFLTRRRSPSGSKSASSIPSRIKSFVRQASISLKMKSPPSKGVREGKEVERIGSKDGVGLPLVELSENPSTS
ncbi:hypothetical protein Tco_1557600 [Tanacetum coccineum]